MSSAPVTSSTSTATAVAAAATIVAWTPNAEQEYVECPHCCGKNERGECGFPMRGCEVCTTYGRGSGHLAKEFRYAAVTVSSRAYPACMFDCVECHDKGTYKRMVDVKLKKEYEDGWSDGGAGLCPRAKFPCWTCKSAEYHAQKKKIEKATRARFAKKHPEMLAK